jgi:hypothetical protein
MFSWHWYPMRNFKCTHEQSFNSNPESFPTQQTDQMCVTTQWNRSPVSFLRGCQLLQANKGQWLPKLRDVTEWCVQLWNFLWRNEWEYRNTLCYRTPGNTSSCCSFTNVQYGCPSVCGRHPGDIRYNSSCSLFNKVTFTWAIALTVLSRSSWRSTGVGGL